MENHSEAAQRIEKLAREVLLLSRNTLLVNLRFMDAALSQFEYVPEEETTLATNGKQMFFNPKYVLSRYRAEKGAPVRDYLHLVMHCVFQHMYNAVRMDRRLWDLSCDIAVESAINGLFLKAVSVRAEQEQMNELQKLEAKIGRLTAEKIYRYLLDAGLEEAEFSRMEKLFGADEHSQWYVIKVQLAVAESRLSNANGGTKGVNEGDAGMAAGQAKIWKGIAERMQMDLETFSKSRGDGGGSLTQNLREVNREKYDYTAFLKKFAVRGEVMKINDDEFDYVFYTYGLKLYEKMPLIEPLEYKELKRIREFVIAIDTSGSVIGSEVQSFVQKTYNILKSTDSFFSKINLHIIQCDAEIQEHVKITSQEEFDAWIKNMKLRGFGGTDFRPVFGLVDVLVKNREFSNLRGLIYFTDGYGVFPEKKPDYEAAFVFVNDDDTSPEVPPWAIKLVLRKEDL